VFILTAQTKHVFNGCRGWFPVQQRLSALLRLIYIVLSDWLLTRVPPSRLFVLHHTFTGFTVSNGDELTACCVCPFLLLLLLQRAAQPFDWIPLKRKTSHLKEKKEKHRQVCSISSALLLRFQAYRDGLDDVQRCSPGVYVSPRFGKDLFYREIHGPAFVSLSSCPQHRLQQPVRAAPPRSKRRQRTVPGRRYEAVCNV
ncbi:hypothetical protein GOODEAATRI_000338, partial [Goodea atripinnis]